MPKIPKSLPVLGKPHEIIQLSEESGESGCMDKGKITININNIDPNDPNDLMHTVLHEFHHALTRRSGIYQGISEELDEVIADVFATALLEAFDISFKKVPRVKRN